eukprot:7103674-Prymnesium_polylepis.1
MIVAVVGPSPRDKPLASITDVMVLLSRQASMVSSSPHANAHAHIVRSTSSRPLRPSDRSCCTWRVTSTTRRNTPALCATRPARR